MDIDQVSTTEERFSDLSRVLSRPSHISSQLYEPNATFVQELSEAANILVIGAGGLGCEILKDLALSGIKQITVIDLDTIDVTNLNRQFLFRKKDVGLYKAQVAAEFVMRRCPGVDIKFHTQPVQKFPDEFFKDFQVIICGLDNVEARRWVNTTVHRLAIDGEGNVDEYATIMIDGGTEGFAGQTRVIKPWSGTACYECTNTAALQTAENTFPLCTVKAIPRLPEHCIAYAMMIEWNENFKRAIDKDSPIDMQWLCDSAQRRADQFGIKGVDYKLTMGVVKNIIPAIASTNALISAACVLETLKCLTGSGILLNNNSTFIGTTGINVQHLTHEKRADCNVCTKSLTKTYNVQADRTLKSFLDQELKQELRLQAPTISRDVGRKYLIAQGIMATSCSQYLEMKFGDLIAQGVHDNSWEWTLIDKTVTTQINLFIQVVAVL